MKHLRYYTVDEFSDLKMMLENSVKKHGDKPAFILKRKAEENIEYRPVSYRMFKNDIDCLGSALINLGLKGKKIALISENRYEWALSYLSVMNGTGMIVPLDKALPEIEIQNLLTRSDANAVIFSSKYIPVMENISNCIKNIKFFINMDENNSTDRFLTISELLAKGRELLNSGYREFIDAEIDPLAMSVVLFTSGTTESSKAVMLSHKNICSDIIAINKVVDIKKEDVFLSVLPLHHAYECTCGFLVPISKGSAITYSDGIKQIMNNLIEYKPTAMLSVPLVIETMYRNIWEQAKNKGIEKNLKTALALNRCLKKINIDISKKLFKALHEKFGGKMRLLICGASSLDEEVEKGFNDFGFLVIQGYGMTECSPVITLNGDFNKKASSLGMPLPGVEVKIEEEAGDTMGEILVKGPTVMLGYYKNEEKTKEILKDGWLCTGDYGFLDKDNYLHITGRKKSLIVTRGGKKVFPEEIEMLLNNIPYIKESVVWGRDNTDSETSIIASIVLNRELILKTHNGNLSDSELKAIIKSNIDQLNVKLPKFKQIREFEIRESEFEKTTTGKIKRPNH